MLTTVLYATLALTVVTLGLSVVAVLRHWWLTRARATHEASAAAHIRRCLIRFLAYDISMEDVQREIRKDRDTAIEVLIGLATELPAPERERLQVFFQQFPFDEREAAMLHGGTWLRRARAASELGLAGRRDSIPELIAALEDDTLDVRLAAAHSLAQIRAPEAAVPILHALTEQKHWPPQRAAEILHEMGSCGIDPLLAFLRGHQGDVPQIRVAVMALGLLHAAAAVPAILTLMDHPDPELRRASACALGQMGDRAAHAALAKALKDPVWEVRCMAAQAFGRLKDDTAVAALARCLDDPAWWVRFTAAEALNQMGEPGIQALKAALSSHPDGMVHDICLEVLEDHGAIGVGGTA
jgi:HEAT repeat protein